MRIIDDGHAFCGRCFVCEASSAEYAKGHVGKEPGGYWKDDKRVGNVFVKISSVQIVEEDEQEPAKWKKLQLTAAQKTDVALKFGWPSSKIDFEDVFLGPNMKMLSIVHLEMLEWMSRRDLDVPAQKINQKIAYFPPSEVANAFARINHIKDQDITLFLWEVSQGWLPPPPPTLPPTTVALGHKTHHPPSRALPEQVVQVRVASWGGPAIIKDALFFVMVSRTSKLQRSWSWQCNGGQSSR